MGLTMEMGGLDKAMAEEAGAGFVVVWKEGIVTLLKSMDGSWGECVALPEGIHHSSCKVSKVSHFQDHLEKLGTVSPHPSSSLLLQPWLLQ